MHDGNLFFAFEEVEKLFQTGKDLFHLTEELVEHFRLLLIAKMQTGSTQLQGLPAELRERYLQSAQLYSQEQALFILDYLISTLQRMQRGGFKKIHIEMALLQIINSKKRITPQTLIRRLIELEKKIESPPMPEKAAPPKPIAKVLPPAEKKAEIPKPADKPEIIASEQAAKPWKHDSVLRFAAVELDGSVKINPS